MNPFDALDSCQINHAVALALGWTYTPGSPDGGFDYYTRGEERWSYAPEEMPDYVHSMDAAQEALNDMFATGHVFLHAVDPPSKTPRPPAVVERAVVLFARDARQRERDDVAGRNILVSRARRVPVLPAGKHDGRRCGGPGTRYAGGNAWS